MVRDAAAPPPPPAFLVARPTDRLRDKSDDVPTTETAWRYLAYTERAAPPLGRLWHAALPSLRLRAERARASFAEFRGYGPTTGAAVAPSTSELSRRMARAATGVTFVYMAGDVAYDTYVASSEYGIAGADLARHASHCILFHGFASYLLPAVAVHTMVHDTQWLFVRLGRAQRVGPALCGLALLPFLPFVVDDAVEFCVDGALDALWPVHHAKLLHKRSAAAPSEPA